MKLFKLPDLGEGLPDAIIREWYVSAGDSVTVDQPLVAMETAKALVDVPSPYTGTIEKLFGEPGDTIDTGEPLVGFAGEAESTSAATAKKDTGTVVGAIETTGTILQESATGVTPQAKTTAHPKATPAIRALARRLGVDLANIQPKGARISAEEVKAATQQSGAASQQQPATAERDTQGLSGVRRAMVLSMIQSQKAVVPVTLCDDADLHAWQTKQDISLRIIRAIAAACQKEPVLNAHFFGDSLSYRLNEVINLGIAVDTPHGLYVPVIKDIANLDDAALRETINRFKTQAMEKAILQEDLHGATILLSNFGTIAGRYANPIVVPPTVAIVGIGKMRDEVVAVSGQAEVHSVMPISLTIDHRAVTGGEAARFLRALIDSLEA